MIRIKIMNENLEEWNMSGMKYFKTSLMHKPKKIIFIWIIQFKNPILILKMLFMYSD